MNAKQLDLHAADALESAACVLSCNGWWTQFVDARDHDGNDVELEDARAECFCTVGGVYAATLEMQVPKVRTRTRAMQALRAEFGRDPVDFNDHQADTFKRDILPHFASAIDKLRGITA